MRLGIKEKSILLKGKSVLFGVDISLFVMKEGITLRVV